MTVDEILKPVRNCARTEQDKRGSAKVELSAEDCSHLIAEIDTLRVIHGTSLKQRDMARTEAAGLREVVDAQIENLISARRWPNE